MAGAYVLLGECLRELGRLWEAVEELQKSLILDVSNARTLRLIGGIYRQLGRVEEAAAYEEKAAEFGESLALEPEVIGLNWTLPES
jgi:tetratricopeptide (TPR) repeat protein